MSAHVPARVRSHARRRTSSAARRMRSPPSLETGSRSHGEAGTEHPHAGKRNALIGSPVERLGGPPLSARPRPVRRRRTASRVLHAVILRSQVAHGLIRGIDVRAARARPGVAAVITAADLVNVPVIPMRQELLPEFAPYQQPVIACGKVRYVGEPLAVVVADSAALAEDALEAIDVDIEPLPVVSDRAQRASGRLAAVRALRFEPCHHADGHARRRHRSGICACAICPARALFGAALHRGDDGAARPDGRLGRGGRAAHRLWRHQGAVPQSPDPRHADGARRAIDQHGRMRRRRWLRRAWRILSRGFPHSLPGASTRRGR